MKACDDYVCFLETVTTKVCSFTRRILLFFLYVNTSACIFSLKMLQSERRSSFATLGLFGSVIAVTHTCVDLCNFS